MEITDLREALATRHALPEFEDRRCDYGFKPSTIALRKAATSVVAFLAAPLRCQGCDDTARDVAIYWVTFAEPAPSAVAINPMRSVYCEECAMIVERNYGGEFVEITAEARE